MKKYIFSILITSLIGTLGWVGLSQAGFGVTPPYVNNDRLTPGSHYEKTIYLVRGQPDEELIAEITIDAPEIENWITIEKGLKFLLPKGVQQFPMKVAIDVPRDAPFGAYEGFIGVRVVPSKPMEGHISTLLGGRIDVSLVVTERGVTDFQVKGISVPYVEIGNPLEVFTVIENTGNTKVGPSKIHVDIYDLNHENILASGDITEIGQVNSFDTKQVGGKMAIDLDLGEYWADITVYKEGESLGENKIYFKVIPVQPKPPPEEESNFLTYLPYIGAAIVLLILLVVIVKKAKSGPSFKKSVTKKRRRRKPKEE